MQTGSGGLYNEVTSDGTLSYLVDFAGAARRRAPVFGCQRSAGITAPLSGTHTVVLDFGVEEFGFTPGVAASFTLPAGTVNGTGIQKFWAEVTEPDSALSFGVSDGENSLSGDVGLTGSISIGGTPPSSVPEPGTAGLLGAGDCHENRSRWDGPPGLSHTPLASTRGSESAHAEPSPERTP